MRVSLTSLGMRMSHPGAFVLLAAYAAAWAIFDRATLDWGGMAMLATLFMTLLIQRAEHRDTQAIHAKLDELLRATNSARNELADIDQREPEDIEEHRRRAMAQGGDARR